MKSVVIKSDLASVQRFSNIESTSIDRSHVINKGLIAAMMANVLWGTSFLASKYTLESWGPFTASALRFAFASTFIYFGLKVFKKQIQTPSTLFDWIWLILCAASGFGILYPLQLTGLKFISSGFSAAIMLLAPILVLSLGFFILKEKFTFNKVLALIKLKVENIRMFFCIKWIFQISHKK